MAPDHIGRLSWLSVSTSPPAVHCWGAESWGQEGQQCRGSGDVTCQPVKGRVSRVPHSNQGVSFRGLRVFMRGGAPECPWNSGHRGEGEHDWLLNTCRLDLCLPGSHATRPWGKRHQQTPLLHGPGEHLEGRRVPGAPGVTWHISPLAQRWGTRSVARPGSSTKDLPPFRTSSVGKLFKRPLGTLTVNLWTHILLPSGKPASFGVWSGCQPVCRTGGLTSQPQPGGDALCDSLFASPRVPQGP